MLKNRAHFIFLVFCLSLLLGYAPKLLAADQPIPQPLADNSTSSAILTSANATTAVNSQTDSTGSTGSTGSEATTTVSPRTNSSTPASANTFIAVPAPALDFLLDPSSKLVLPEILLPENQAKFAPLRELPPKTGRMWLRLTAQPGLLDLNSRILGLVPGQAKVWTLSPQKAPQVSTAIANNIFPIAEAAQVYLSLDGVPGLGFTPLLRPTDSLNFFDRHGQSLVLGLLAIALLLCLMRGLTEKREWRMWAALYITALLVNTFWGLPISLDNTVGSWEMPALFAPGIALLLLPQLGRHLMRTRLEAPKLDMCLLLVSLMGLIVPAAALFPSQTWIIRFLPYWPLALILTLPLALWACSQRLTKSYLFLSLVILPILGIVLISPSVSAVYPWLVSFTSLPPSASISILSLTPLFFVSLSALELAFSPSPSLGTGAVRVNRKGKPDSKADPRLDSRLELVPHDLTQELALDLPVEPSPISKFAKQIHQPLDVFWDTFWRELSFLEAKLPLEAKNHYLSLSQAGHALSQKLAKLQTNPQKRFTPDQKIETTPLQYFDLNQMLLAVHDKIAPDAESKNLALSWFVAPHLPRIYEGNYAALHEVLNLLAQSSVMATDRGLIQIKAGRLPESTDPGHLLFSVVDTGKGTPPEKRSTLALVRAWELIGPQGGSLTVDSGQSGTNISFSLHLKPKLAPTQASSSQKLDASLVQKMILRIIVASASSSNRQLLAYYLDELPHEILEATSAEEVYTLYTRSPGSLLIFDDDLPIADLSQALAQIRAFEGEHSFPLASILALVSDETKAETLRRAGCTHILQKPIVRQKLRLLALRLAPVPKRHALDLTNLPTATNSKPAPVEKSPPEPKLEQPATSSATKPPHEKAYKKDLLSSIFSFSGKATSDSPKKNLPELAPKKHRIISNVGDPIPIAGDPNHVPFKILPSHKATEASPPVLSQNTQAPPQATEWVGEPKPIVKTPREETKTPRPETTAQPGAEPMTQAESIEPSIVPLAKSIAPHNMPQPAAWIGEPLSLAETENWQDTPEPSPEINTKPETLISTTKPIVELKEIESTFRLKETGSALESTEAGSALESIEAESALESTETGSAFESTKAQPIKPKQIEPVLETKATQPSAFQATLKDSIDLSPNEVAQPVLKTAPPYKYELILKPEPNNPPQASLENVSTQISKQELEPEADRLAKPALSLQAEAAQPKAKTSTLATNQKPQTAFAEPKYPTSKEKNSTPFLLRWFSKPKPEPSFQLPESIEWVGEPKPVSKVEATRAQTEWVGEPKPVSKVEATRTQTEWVGEPKPLLKSQAVSPAPDHMAAMVQARPASSPQEWVGEPMPIPKPMATNKSTAISSSSVKNSSDLHTQEWVGEPMPIPKAVKQYVEQPEQLEQPVQLEQLEQPVQLEQLEQPVQLEQPEQYAESKIAEPLIHVENEATEAKVAIEIPISIESETIAVSLSMESETTAAHIKSDHPEPSIYRDLSLQPEEINELSSDSQDSNSEGLIAWPKPDPTEPKVQAGSLLTLIPFPEPSKAKSPEKEERELDSKPQVKAPVNQGLTLFDALEMPNPKAMKRNLEMNLAKPINTKHPTVTPVSPEVEQAFRPMPLEPAPATPVDDEEIITLTDQVVDLPKPKLAKASRNLPDLFGDLDTPSKPNLPDLFGDLDNPMPDLNAALLLAQQGQVAKDYDTILMATTKLRILAENFALHTIFDISTCLAEAAYTQNKSEVDSFIADLKHALDKMNP